MRKLFLLGLMSAILCGCAGTQKKGAAWNDAFERVKVDQMSGNHVSGLPIQRTILCLNGRRETRVIPAETNAVVVHATNQVVSYVTNYMFSSVTNLLANISTNQLVPTAPALPVDTNDPAALVVMPPPPQGTTTNSAVTRTADHTLTVNNGKDQSVSTLNLQSSVTMNQQLTTTLGSQAVSVNTNQTIRNESTLMVTALTNYLLTSITNVVVRPLNKVVHEHYLYTEFTPPPDFTLAQGESLILLLDGQRFAFTPTNSASFSGRREFVSTLYKASPEALTAIANAKDARLRLRGATYSIERELSQNCRNNFREFLLRYYVPAASLENLRSTPDGAAETATQSKTNPNHFATQP